MKVGKDWIEKGRQLMEAGFFVAWVGECLRFPRYPKLVGTFGGSQKPSAFFGGLGDFGNNCKKLVSRPH